MAYDPSTNPDTRHWLSLTEEQRLAAVLEYHDGIKAKLPNARLHAALHVTVENQLAEQYGPAVETLARLIGEGLDRHEAVHAIVAVIAAQMQQWMQRSVPKFDQAAYERDLAVLTAERWRREFG